ncbi:hypothetical protein OIV83_003153 [Microbotryomycetes sp. JL201]|nr:hypothetical protein OIV83_003153 [Microbotryomycetes sp. JL201]
MNALDQDQEPDQAWTWRRGLLDRARELYRQSFVGRHQLTLLGRCTLLLVGELAVNLLLWIVALAMFAPDKQTRGVLSLCLIAWTLGLRHGLDMDHIIAIDVVTRRLVSMSKEPVCVGLFFSLGHSSIVLGATIAIVAAVSAIDKIPDVSAVGGVIGKAAGERAFSNISVNSRHIEERVGNLLKSRAHSAETLYYRLQRQQNENLAETIRVLPADGRVAQCDFDAKADVDEKNLQVGDLTTHAQQQDTLGLQPTTCLARIGRPVFKMIDASWKMYPVGVLFGFGFDTASEITLLGVSAIASSHAIPRSQVLLLPFLFTAGMTLVDSLDSVFMLHAYIIPGQNADVANATGELRRRKWWSRVRLIEAKPTNVQQDDVVATKKALNLPAADQSKLLKIQIVLTAMSIVIAFLISFVQFMSLALEKCSSCADAAENDSGLSGRWWRFWAEIGDDSTYIGAGVVALFIIVFGSWFVVDRCKKRKALTTTEEA